MNNTKDNNLKFKLKKLIICELSKEINPEDISDDEELFSGECALGLDSLDGLQISMALNREYGVMLNDSKIVRKVMRSMNTLAEYIEENKT